MSKYSASYALCLLTSMGAVALSIPATARADTMLMTPNGTCWVNSAGFVYGCSQPPPQMVMPPPGASTEQMERAYQQGAADAQQQAQKQAQQAEQAAKQQARQRAYRQREAVATAIRDRQVEEGQRDGAYWAAQREKYEAQQRSEEGLSNKICRFRGKSGTTYAYCEKTSKPEDVVIQ